MSIYDPITNDEDYIDSRDVIARIDYLESLEEEDRDEDEAAELAELRAFAEDGETLADWPHGETLIRDSYFEDYARELAEDIGAVSRDAQWPLGYIDWEAAADALKIDYTSLDFGGETYWGRS